VQPPGSKTIEVSVVVPVEDMAALGESTGPVRGGSAAGALAFLRGRTALAREGLTG